MKTLKSLGIDENTLVIFASDNGPWLGQGDQSGTAAPLKGGKFSTWEGGVRVPCIMRWPGKVPQGIECQEVAGIIDIFPTFAKLIGTSMPADRTIDGKDIYPLMSGQPEIKSPHDAYLFYRWGRLEGVRSGNMKYHLNGKKWELFDLERDIRESKDISNSNPDIVARMETLLAKAREDMGDKLTKQTGRNCRPLGKIE